MKASQVQRLVMAMAVFAGAAVAGFGALQAHAGGWITLAPMPDARSGAAAGVIDGRLHVVGGTPLSGLDKHHVYDPATNSWAARAAPLTHRVFAMSGVINRKLYVAGGCVGSDCRIGTTGALEVYDPDTDTWTSLAPMPTPRSSGAGAVIDGKLYVTGGYRACPPCSTPQSLEVYDPVTNTWDTTRASLPLGQAETTGVGLNGRMYVIGGNGATGQSPGNVQVYDSATDTWSLAAALPTPRGPVAAVVHNGLIQTFGGFTPNGAVATAETYDPVSGTWTTEIPMPTARSRAVAGVLAGRVHVVSGLLDSGAGTGANEVLEVLGTDPPPPPPPPPPADPVLVSISVSPSAVTMSPGQSQTLQAIGHYSDGSTRILPSGSGDSGGGSTGPNRPIWSLQFVSSQLNVSACATPQHPAPITFAGQAFTDVDGSVHETWSPGTPVVDVDGSIDATSVTLTLACTNGAATGTIAAQWTGTRYEGTFTFAGGASSGTVSITGWSAQAPLPVPRFSLAAAAVDGIVYALGGGNPSLPSTIYAYTPSTNSWSTAGQMATPREGPGAAVVNGRIYVVGGHVAGGIASGVIEAYDPTSQSWITGLAPMPTPRAHLAVVTDGVYIYAAGGDTTGTNGGIVDTLERYDPATNTWVTLAPMPSAGNFIAGGVLNGTIVVVGAGGNGGVSTATHVYEIATNTWRAGPPMPAARSMMAAAVANGGLYVIGGNGPSPYSTFVYYPPANTPNGFRAEYWSGPASIPTSRSQLAAAAVGDVIYAIGGMVPGSNPAVQFDTNEAFSTPPVNTFAPGGNPSGGGGGGFNSLPSVQWQSTNPSAAGVNGFGNVQATAIGQTTIVATASNGMSCLASNTCASVTVADSQPPFLNVPNDATREAQNGAGALVTYFTSAFDNIDGPRPVNCHPPSGSQFPLGTTIVTCWASDTSGNTTTRSFVVTVRDTNAPFLGLPNNMIREATGPAGATVTFFVSASDSVDGQRPVTCSHTSGSNFSFGSTTVTCSASDLSGNTKTGSFTITVQDTKPPSIGVPGNMTREANSPSGATVTFFVSANDTVDGQRPVTCNPPSGSTFSFGTTTVTCTASDTRGNTATRSFTIAVVDTRPPVIEEVTPSQAVLWSPNHKMVPITIAVSVVDAGDSAPACTITSVSSNEAVGETAPDWEVTGPLSVQLRAERDGNGSGRVYTIAITCRDRSGNVSHATTNVTVPHDRGR